MYNYRTQCRSDQSKAFGYRPICWKIHKGCTGHPLAGSNKKITNNSLKQGRERKKLRVGNWGGSPLSKKHSRFSVKAFG